MGTFGQKIENRSQMPQIAQKPQETRKTQN
jgi:hypothetical protein